MKLFFDDTEFDGQLQRTAAKVRYGAADLGEVLAIAARITPGDYDSWYEQWFAAGDANRALAEAEAAQGHRVSAAEAYLRASECYRSAYFFCRRHPHGHPLLAAWRACRQCFRDALPLLPTRVERIEIPYEDIHLQGYVVHPERLDDGAGPPPVLLLPCGYDSPVEEGWTLGAADAAARGFAVVLFSGPGQAEMLYERGIPFRHDFEAVVGPVIDVVERRDDLDASRIGLWGRSFGGYLAPRAATAERRVKALAADPAQTDMGAALRSRFPAEWIEMIDAGDLTFDEQVWELFPGEHGQEFWLARARSHGLDSPLAYVQEMQRWVVDVEAIGCPTFASYGEGDFAQLTTDDFHQRLTVPKVLRVYRDADGSGGHCEGMGPSRYFADVLGWLADQLGPPAS